MEKHIIKDSRANRAQNSGRWLSSRRFFIKQLGQDTRSRTRIGMKCPGKEIGKSKILDLETQSWKPA